MKKPIYLAILFALLSPMAWAQIPGTPPGKQLAQAKFLIEHNASDSDTGYQFFVDGEAWNALKIQGPLGTILNIETSGNLSTLGLTEGFFETNEPNNSDVPLEQILALFPEGEYVFEATPLVGGPAMTLNALLSHNLPAQTEILTPTEEETLPVENVVISWNPVTQTINGQPATILGYQVIVEEDVESSPSASFFKNQLSVFVPATQTSLTVPSEFLQAGKDYEIEVLAIEESGNQTISIRTFKTAPLE